MGIRLGQPVAGQQQLLSPSSQAAVQERGGACQQDAKLLQPRSTNSSVSSKSPSSFLKVSGPLQDRPDPCFLLAPMTPEATGDIDMALMDIQDDTELGALMAEPQDADLGDLDALPTVLKQDDWIIISDIVIESYMLACLLIESHVLDF